MSDRAIEMKKYQIRKCPCKTKGWAFPCTIEDDPLVYFHATPATNFKAIKKGGFKSKAELCGDDNNPLSEDVLPSVSFGKTSSVAYAYLMKSSTLSEKWCIFAVLYENTDPKNLREQGDSIHPCILVPPPKIIGYCFIPAGHKYCYSAPCQFKSPK